MSTDPADAGRGSPGTLIENRATHAAFIRANLDVAAAWSWRCYLEQGRCAFVVVSEWGEARIPWHAGTTPGMLAPATDLLAALDDPDLARLLDEYDPQREVVFVFLRTDGGMSAYRVLTDPAPPQAFVELGGQLREFRLTRREFAKFRARSASAHQHDG